MRRGYKRKKKVKNRAEIVISGDSDCENCEIGRNRTRKSLFNNERKRGKENRRKKMTAKR